MSRVASIDKPLQSYRAAYRWLVIAAMWTPSLLVALALSLGDHMTVETGIKSAQTGLVLVICLAIGISIRPVLTWIGRWKWLPSFVMAGIHAIEIAWARQSGALAASVIASRAWPVVMVLVGVYAVGSAWYDMRLPIERMLVVAGVAGVGILVSLPLLSTDVRTRTARRMHRFYRTWCWSVPTLALLTLAVQVGAWTLDWTGWQTWGHAALMLGISLGLAWVVLHFISYDERRSFQELGKARFQELADYPRVTIKHDNGTEKPALHVGEGCPWDQDRLQEYLDASREPLSLVNPDPSACGDTRIFGTCWRQAEERKTKYSGVCFPEDDANRHMLILAATGSGKTVLASHLVGQEIAVFRTPGVFIDPKGDQALRRRIQRECLRAGLTFRFFDLADPANSIRYNPVAQFRELSQIADRMASLMPDDSQQPFFKQNATQTCYRVAHGIVGVRDFMLACGKEVILRLEARRIRELALMERGAGAANAAPPEVKLEDVQLPEVLTPQFWVPKISMFGKWGIARPHELYEYCVRFLGYHRLRGDLRRVDGVDLGSAHQTYTTYGQWKFEKHPIEDLDAVKDPEIRDIFKRVKDPERLKRAVELLRKGADFMWDSAGIQESNQGGFTDYSEKRRSENSCLNAVCDTFSGPRARLVESATSDIDWDKVVESKEFIYMSMSSLENRVAANEFPKVILEDLMNWAGRKSRLTDNRPFFLGVDEAGAVVPKSIVDFLARTRSAGFRCLLIGQTAADFAVRLGGEDPMRQIVGNCNTVFIMRSLDQKDAATFSNRLEKVRVQVPSRSLNLNSTYGNDARAIAGNTVGDSLSYQETDMPLVPDNLPMSLPLGQGFMSVMGADKVYLFQVPLVRDYSRDWEKAALSAMEGYDLPTDKEKRRCYQRHLLGRAYDAALRQQAWNPEPKDAEIHVREAVDRGALKEHLVGDTLMQDWEGGDRFAPGWFNRKQEWGEQVAEAWKGSVEDQDSVAASGSLAQRVFEEQRRALDQRIAALNAWEQAALSAVKSAAPGLPQDEQKRVLSEAFEIVQRSGTQPKPSDAMQHIKAALANRPTQGARQ